MPLFQHYTRQVTDSQLADLNNIGKYSRYVSRCLQRARRTSLSNFIYLRFDCYACWFFYLFFPSSALAAHAQQLHSSESLSRLLIGLIWTSLAWWVTKMKFLIWGKACQEDRHVRWWSSLLDWLTAAERWTQNLKDRQDVFCQDSTVTCSQRAKRQGLNTG